MLFSKEGFRLYNRDGTLICEQAISNAGSVYNQKYCKDSGNLVVTYKDALTIYSGQDGKVIFQETDLRSVFYAPYGVSILDADGQLRVIDLDSGVTVTSLETGAGVTFAAYCGSIIDDEYLDGRKLIGATKKGDGYIYAISDDINSAVDRYGRKLFSVPVTGVVEAFYTDKAVIISPLYGVPAVFSIGNGKKIANLEKDAYLTDVTQMGEYVICQYISTDGEHFGMLLDSTFQPIATLPRLCDIYDGQLMFDYQNGVLRRSRVYEIDELLDIASGKEE